MTLVYREERKSLFDQESTESSIGPGSYFSTDGKQKSKRSKDIGFLSKVDNSLQSVSKMNMPGPGHYVSHQDIQHTIGNKYDAKSSCFLSKVNRFRQKTEKQSGKQNTQLPISPFGQMLKQRHRQRQRAHPPRPQQKHKLRQIPSIPCRSESYGYQVNEQGSYEVNKSPLERCNGKDRSVGPGSYNLNSVYTDFSSGSAWSNSKVKRKIFQPSSLLAKHTQLSDQISQKKVDKGCFMSKLPRHIDSISQRKYALLQESLKRKFGGYYEGSADSIIGSLKAKLNDGKVNLGPGSYQKIDAENKNDLKRYEQHCFLSKSPRFQSNNSKKVTQQTQTLPTLQNSEEFKTINGNLNKASRFEKNLHSSMPGPGAYITDLSYLKNKYSFAKEPRFGSKLHDCIPGPGDYILDTSVLDVNKGPSFGSILKKKDLQAQYGAYQEADLKSDWKSADTNKQESNFVPFYSTVERQCIYPVEKEAKIWAQQDQKPRAQYPQRHLYEAIRKNIAINRMSEQCEPPGPGSYNIASDLSKSTFNITSKVEYVARA